MELHSVVVQNDAWITETLQACQLRSSDTMENEFNYFVLWSFFSLLKIIMCIALSKVFKGEMPIFVNL